MNERATYGQSQLKITAIVVFEYPRQDDSILFSARNRVY